MIDFIKEFIRETPYNDFAQILKFHGVEANEKLGGNCISHSIRFAERAKRVLGLDSKFIAGNPFHISPVIEEDGTDFFYDPSMGIREGLNISELFRSRSERVLSAYPKVKGEATVWHAKPLSKTQFSISKPGTYVEFDTMYMSRNINVEKLCKDKSLFYGPSNNFRWNAVLEDGSAVKTVFDPDAGKIKLISSSPVDLKAVLERFGSTKEELEGYFIKAAGLRNAYKRKIEEIGIDL